MAPNGMMWFSYRHDQGLGLMINKASHDWDTEWLWRIAPVLLLSKWQPCKTEWGSNQSGLHLVVPTSFCLIKRIWCRISNGVTTISPLRKWGEMSRTCIQILSMPHCTPRHPSSKLNRVLRCPAVGKKKRIGAILTHPPLMELWGWCRSGVAEEREQRGGRGRRIGGSWTVHTWWSDPRIKHVRLSTFCLSERSRVIISEENVKSGHSHRKQNRLVIVRVAGASSHKCKHYMLLAR